MELDTAFLSVTDFRFFWFCRTNKHYQKLVHAVGTGQGTHKKLEKYYPNAPRNRPKETVSRLPCSCPADIMHAAAPCHSILYNLLVPGEAWLLQLKYNMVVQFDVSHVQMENVVGNRHKLHPCIKHERYRGSSQIKFSDGDPDSSRPWKTTNQVQCLLTIALSSTACSVLCINSTKVYLYCTARARLMFDAAV